jgi:hypothetical protein
MSETDGSDDRYEFDGFAFIGRTFTEYRRMFDLDPASLAGLSVLDCPGGPSSFAAVAAEFGADLTAVDPAYAPDRARVASACEAAIEETASQLQGMRDAFVWDEYGDVETRLRYLRAAANRFLADFGHRPGRYVRTGLPDLPFERDAFDLALSGNFLFLYDEQRSLEFHFDAIREILRVAGELRVFPLTNLEGSTSEHLKPVLNRLFDSSVRVEIRMVPYEFQKGSNQGLVLQSPSEPDI